MTGSAVWITGCGAVTAAGPTSGSLAGAVQAGRSAVRAVDEFGGLHCAPIDELPKAPLGSRLDRSAMIFVSAAEEAWRSAGFDDMSCEPGRIAVFEGSALGNLAATVRAISSGRVTRARPLDIVRFMPGAGGANFAQAHGIRGPVLQISAGSVSALCAIGEAYLRILSGTVDVAVAGGSECPLEESIVARFRASGLLSQTAADVAPCRPFDRTRQGTVLGEGGGAVVLESEAHAIRRGAIPRAFLSGYGFASEAHSLIAPDPSGTGVRQAAQQAIGTWNGEPGWIKTHGTGTRAGDSAEYFGLAAAFERRLPAIPVTSLKPLIGHCLGASGAIEAVAAVLALELGIAPATLGTTEVDPAFPLCDLALDRRCCANRSALLLAQSFGGRCAALFVRAP